MRIALTPLAAALLTAWLPMLPLPVLAAELGQISIGDPTGSTHLTLNPDDTVTYTGVGPAIGVSNGNSVQGDKITVNVTPPAGVSGTGVQVTAGGTATFTNSSIQVLGGANPTSAVKVTGAGSLVSLTGTRVTGSFGAWMEGGRLEMNGGSLTAGDTALYFRSSVTPASAKISNVTLTSTGLAGGLGDGIHIDSAGTSVVLENVSISALIDGIELQYGALNSTLSATGFDITAGKSGVINRGGQVTLVDGTIKSNHWALAVVGWGPSYSATLQATRVHVLTQTSNGHGAIVDGPGAPDTARILLEDSTITTQGPRVAGLYGMGPGALLSARNSTITSTGSASVGARAQNGARIALDQTRVATEGANGHAIWSHHSGLAWRNNVSITNGSQIDTRDGIGVLASGGDHAFVVSDSAITARTGGSIDNGVLLQSEALGAYAAGQVTLDASGSVLTGDVIAKSGRIDISLKNGSQLTGAMAQRTGGLINRLTLDANSVWNVRGDSTLGAVANAGTVAFTAPAGGTGFKTLTVNDYSGGGTLVLNTQLGDDTSATDKLVIDGGAATSGASLRVLNAGGDGALTETGIRLVQTLNGGTTAADAFRLDAGSTGYRASARTLALNGYEYSLVRGGNGGVAADWYLTSDVLTVIAPTDLIPAKPIDPLSPDVIAPPTQPAAKNVSPESGAFLGNQLASAHFFTHGASDRLSAYGGGSLSQAQPDAGDDGDASADRSQMSNTGRRLWTRVEGRQDSGLRLSQGRVTVDADSSVLQLGGDLIHAPLNQGGAVYAGLMGGRGDARTTSTSTLTLPGGGTVQARARGKVSGYAVGVYGTVYQNDATRMGAYADTWLQYGRYTNHVNSELGSTQYRSTAWTASIEAGYAVKPFADGSVLGPVVLEPRAQLVYNRYDAQDATLQGTRMHNGGNSTWNSSIGVRLYPQASPNAPAVRPFLETNWLHSFGSPSVGMGPNRLDASVARNTLELKLGAEARIGRKVQLSGHVFSQAANNNQRGYGGMLNVRYRW